MEKIKSYTMYPPTFLEAYVMFQSAETLTDQDRELMSEYRFVGWRRFCELREKYNWDDETSARHVCIDFQSMRFEIALQFAQGFEAGKKSTDEEVDAYISEPLNFCLDEVFANGFIAGANAR